MGKLVSDLMHGLEPTIGFDSILSQIINSSGTEKRELTTVDGFTVKIERPVSVRNVFDHEKSHLPLVYLMSGPSESGKSTFGRLLRRDSVATRFKILKLVRELSETELLPRHPDLGSLDPTETLNHLYHHGPDIYRSAGKVIVDNLVRRLEDWDTPMATVETVSLPWIVEAFRSHPGIRTLSIFMNPPRELRIAREAEKEGITIAEAAKIVEVKDSTKSSLGIWEIRELTDIVIVNSGNLSSLQSFVRSLGNTGKRFTREFSGIPNEFK